MLIREVVLGTRMKLNHEALTFGFGNAQGLDGYGSAQRDQSPALVLAGSDDFQFPPKYQAALSAGIEGSRLEIIERAGHNVQSERPFEVMEAITGFIDF